MSKKLLDFFGDKQNAAAEQHFSADGGFADDFDLDGDDFNFMDDDGFSADGGQGNSVATSQPYIVNVENTTTNDISAVTLLGAYSNVGQSAPAFGNTTGISITMGITTITYSEFLYQSMNKPFVVGLTYMSSTSQSQVQETMTLTQKDANGNVASKILTPTIDPYQQQNSIIAFKYNYTIDGFTSLVISRILAKSGSQNGNLKLQFYPAESVSTTRALGGKKPVKGFGNPGVVRPQSLQLTKSSARALRG